MDSIKNGATIRIGFEINLTWPEYSLKIDKKTVLKHSSRNVVDYLAFYKEGAKEMAKIMNDRNVSNYVIYNGELLKPYNQWGSCYCIPFEGKELFTETLEAHLK